jgi:hypothetical protein
MEFENRVHRSNENFLYINSLHSSSASDLESKLWSKVIVIIGKFKEFNLEEFE